MNVGLFEILFFLTIFLYIAENLIYLALQSAK